MKQNPLSDLPCNLADGLLLRNLPAFAKQLLTLRYNQKYLKEYPDFKTVFSNLKLLSL